MVAEEKCCPIEIDWKPHSIPFTSLAFYLSFTAMRICVGVRPFTSSTENQKSIQIESKYCSYISNVDFYSSNVFY